jgi:hypothetical protein
MGTTPWIIAVVVWFRSASSGSVMCTLSMPSLTVELLQTHRFALAVIGRP